ncbi:ABC transporter ATP-binding protein [Ruminococcus sp. HUN007]|uniref:ABC transporter ATP-binding protein n=1 Tax=Ruminococcus sp. HUN007 TaxID=1514668 RepID=UPI0009DDBBD7|nr:ABC transporter ATP-binding protein [Ruminococcus sp. HUN007]
MIEVRNLCKHYGDKKAVNNISFEVKDGEILGFLGPNGAGKSTTMNMITGYISSTSGEAIINGVDIMENPKKAKSFIGYLPEIPPIYVDMTVGSYLNFVYDLKKCKLPRSKHIKDVCDLVKITDVKDRIIKNLSKGYKQRVGLAQALIGNPPVLILDEPTVGLDPKQIIEIRSLIKRLGKNHTVILSSHILSEIQAVCDRIVIINKGTLVADGTADELANNMSGDHKMIAQIEGPRKDVYTAVRNLPDVVSVAADMERGENIYDYEIETKPGTDIRKALNKLIRERGWDLLMLQPNILTLEDVFLKIITGEHEMKQALSEEQKQNIAKAVDVKGKVDAAAGDLREVLEGIEAKKKAEASAAEEDTAEETAAAPEVSETDENSEAESDSEEKEGDEE